MHTHERPQSLRVYPDAQSLDDNIAMLNTLERWYMQALRERDKASARLFKAELDSLASWFVEQHIPLGCNVDGYTLWHDVG